MKTIKEAAMDYCSETDGYKFIAHSPFKSFEAGVEFAQRWIPVEEELPEKSKQVIVKLENGWHTCTWITGDGTFAFNVKPTHWRYIDLK